MFDFLVLFQGGTAYLFLACLAHCVVKVLMEEGGGRIADGVEACATDCFGFCGWAGEICEGCGEEEKDGEGEGEGRV